MIKLLTNDTLGLIAGALTTLAFLPQIIKTYRSKSADEVSFATFTMFAVGVALWDLYGIKIHSIPVVVANSITFILSLSIVIMKVIFSINKK